MIYQENHTIPISTDEMPCISCGEYTPVSNLSEAMCEDCSIHRCEDCYKPTGHVDKRFCDKCEKELVAVCECGLHYDLVTLMDECALVAKNDYSEVYQCVCGRPHAIEVHKKVEK